MCGRYTLYTDEQAEEIRQIIDIAQRQVRGQLKLGEVFPSDRAQSWWQTWTRSLSGRQCGGSPVSRARAC